MRKYSSDQSYVPDHDEEEEEEEEDENVCDYDDACSDSDSLDTAPKRVTVKKHQKPSSTTESSNPFNTKKLLQQLTFESEVDENS